MIGVLDPYRAWCFDEAAMEFGLACEAAMEDARNSGSKSKGKGKGLSEKQKAGKADNALRKMLGLEQKFSDITSLKPKPKQGE